MSILFDNLYKKDNKIFAKCKINKDQPILEFSGNIFSGEKIFEENLILDLPKGKYIGPSGNLDDYVNHSCNPNSRVIVVTTRAFLYSIKNIKPNEEVTFDYSTIMKSNIKFDCKCKQFNCRKIIGNLSTVNEQTLKKYKELNLIPSFILENK
jgi:hypothetical protein